jgi:hypothetical protein
MMILVACLLFMLLAAGLAIRSLQRRCRQMAGLKETWKEYAIALETWVDCSLELEDTTLGCRKRSAIASQKLNAEELAEMAVGRLFDCGEYPDASESSPFLS